MEKEEFIEELKKWRYEHIDLFNKYSQQITDLSNLMRKMGVKFSDTD